MVSKLFDCALGITTSDLSFSGFVAAAPDLSGKKTVANSWRTPIASVKLEGAASSEAKASKPVIIFLVLASFMSGTSTLIPFPARSRELNNSLVGDISLIYYVPWSALIGEPDLMRNS